MVQLGDHVIDTVSGYSGVAVALHIYLNGCRRVSVQPKATEQGTKLPEPESFDEPQLKVLKAAKVKDSEAVPTGGPAPYRDKRRY